MFIWAVMCGEDNEGQDLISLWSARKRAESAALRLAADFEPWQQTAHTSKHTEWRSGVDVLTVRRYRVDRQEG